MDRYRQSLVILLLCSLLNVNAQDHPTPRASAHLFYFKTNKSLLLFDGYESGTRPLSGKAEIWAWKNKWNKIDSTDQPLRSLSAATYLYNKDQVFVYGGIGSKGYDDSLREAYIYDGKKWKTIADNSAGTRDHHEVAYDENNQMIVVYGGQNSQREFETQTWIMKDDRWKALNIPGPGPRVHHAMAYDATRKVIVLYGGSSEISDFDETWEFDGIRWNQITATINPGARTHHSMVYDPVSKRTLLYGGGVGMKAKGDIWSWDGKKWELLSDNGPQRILAALAIDPDNKKLYVFGGNGGESFLFIYSDLWEWDGKQWAKIEKGDTYKFDMQKNMFVMTRE